MGRSVFVAPMDITAIRFMEDEFGPVATSALASALGLGEGAGRLEQAVGLAIRSAPGLWNDWFGESGIQPANFAKVQEFEDLLLAIGAARSGIGVAIAPKTAIGEDLARGTLVAPYGFIRRPAGFTSPIPFLSPPAATCATPASRWPAWALKSPPPV